MFGGVQTMCGDQA